MKKDSAATGRKHSGLAYIASAVGDILLPRTCAVCGRRLLVNERHLCTFCISDIPLTYNWNTKYHDIADRFNAFLQEDIHGYEPYSYVANLFFYNRDNGYRHICHKLKYQGNIRIGKHFSRRACTALLDKEMEQRLQPVGYHRERNRVSARSGIPPGHTETLPEHFLPDYT